MIQGIVAGGVAGLVGSWAMSEAQRLWTHVADGDPPESAAGRHDARDWQERSEHRNANEEVAQIVACRLLGRTLTLEELRVAAPLVHYLFGATVAAAYAAYVDRRPAARSATALGAAVWLAADEIALPVAGLSESTTRRPVEIHLQSLAAHLVFGVVVETVRRSIRNG